MTVSSSCEGTEAKITNTPTPTSDRKKLQAIDLEFFTLAYFIDLNQLLTSDIRQMKRRTNRHDIKTEVLT